MSTTVVFRSQKGTHRSRRQSENEAGVGVQRLLQPTANGKMDKHH